MQVKKFEAKTMREALLMVKKELGPEAIILSAKDIKKGYGLAGGTSVELTAAISETKYRERQFALQKLKEEDKRKFNEAPAMAQKKFIEKSVRQYRQEQEQHVRIPLRPQYIAISDEAPPVVGKTVENIVEEQKNVTRVKNAAQSAMQAFDKDFADRKAPKKIISKPQSRSSNQEVQHLRQEIERLHSVIESFQKLPQNFVGTHPGADFGLPFELSFMFEKLVDSGMNRELTAEILEKAKRQMSAVQMKKKALVEAWTAKYILDSIKVCGEKPGAKVEVFIGSTGAGKTSSLVKYASHQLIFQRKSVAIVTTDTNKVGAIEQLKIYAQILNVPFAIIRHKEDWTVILQKLSNVDLILVDTPGLSLKDINEIENMKSRLNPIHDKARIHYVMSAANNESIAFDLAKRFKIFHYDDLIFNKLDESSHHGILYSLSHMLECPLHSFGIGPQIPEDYEFATRERVLDLIFKITKKG